MTTECTHFDATPGAHNSVDALAVVSFKLACGCNVRAGSEPTRRIELKNVGSSYPCLKHGSDYDNEDTWQVITRATFRLAGWEEPSEVSRWMRAAAKKTSDG
jgi:hypothetical protein